MAEDEKPALSVDEALPLTTEENGDIRSGEALVLVDEEQETSLHTFEDLQLSREMQDRAESRDLYTTTIIKNKVKAEDILEEEDVNETAAQLRSRRRRTSVLFQDPNDIENDDDDDDDDPQQKKGLARNSKRKNRQSVAMQDGIRLATSQKYANQAVLAVFFCVFVDAINLQCAAPNYPLMVTIGGHPDSFPSTNPFDFAAAQYMLYSASKFGAFISNLTAGTLSDRYGRRTMLIIDLTGSVIFTLGKYFARNAYWSFVAMTFVNGLFGSSASVAVGYMADIFLDDRAKADTYMNHVIAIALLGRSLGGLFTVMFPNDLFLPLLPASAITFLGLVVAYKFVLEPKGIRAEQTKKQDAVGDEAAKKAKEGDAPETMDYKTLFNIIFGAVMDNAGSAGIVPLALSPLMFEVFHNGFVEEGLEPIMREQTYRWLYSMIALIVVPGALVSPFCYQKFGVAMSCVLANLVTAVTIFALLYVGLFMDPTTATYVACATILYMAFPFTLISVLSTGPMLDRIAPLDQKGFAQGLYGAVIDGADAIFPLVLGLIADKHGMALAFWICIGISVFAAIVNLPLVFHPRLQKPKAEVGDDDVTVAMLDEEEIKQRLEDGDFVPSKDLWAVNVKRLDRGDPFLYTRVGTYFTGCADEINVPKEEYQFLRDMAEQRLLLVKENPDRKADIVEAFNLLNADTEQIERDRQELGEWFSSYMVDNGYRPGEQATILKGMIKTSFPQLSPRHIAPENIEVRLVRIAKLMNDYMEREGLEEPPAWFRAFAGRTTQR